MSRLATSNKQQQDTYKAEIGAGIRRRLRATRLERGLSITALASAAGVARASLLTAEGEKTATGASLRVASVAAIAAALGVRAGWLAFGEGPRDL
jgi:transcriptional regulator with XRE-family HTH domain